MPFVLLTEISSFLPQAMVQKLSADTEAEWLKIQPQVNEIIANESGIAEPDNSVNAPQWLRLPAAWLTAYLAEYMLTGKSREYLEKSKHDYEQAIAMLRARKPAKASSSTSGVGEIGGLYGQF